MKEYITYRCKICGSSFILPAIEVRYNEDKGNYLTCPFRGHKSIIVTGAYDSLKEVMGNTVYKKEGRRIRQLK